MAQIAGSCLHLASDRKVVLSVLTTATFTGVLVTLVFALTLKTTNTGNTSTTANTTAAELRYVEKRPEDGTLIQQLQSMDCKPHLHKVRVMDLVVRVLDPTDEKLDKQFKPSFLPVWRCNETLSYCGDNLGMDHGRVCKPVRSTNKSFTVQYEGKRGLRNMNVSAEVHLDCQCSDV
ncbi:uncharacterized protein LOC122264421 [Penaeus japonicus]|uniref:uncharacterized protein LOC122264421 n=1 Tax=Penaeus japonicus TaxID=27405 RepID=UPI001C713D4B|nr:uncharacterized protein LOC122264421 [Penaeus japonicus]